MASKKIRYRKLRGYKYQLRANYQQKLDKIRPEGGDVQVNGGWVKLSADGPLFVKNGYAWDGPSGPTIDTPDFLRASLVHDALYQLMRERKLKTRRWRKPADQLLRDMCIEDGMSKVRAEYVYAAMCAFGGPAARPGGQKQEVLTAP